MELTSVVVYVAVVVREFDLALLRRQAFQCHFPLPLAHPCLYNSRTNLAAAAD